MRLVFFNEGLADTLGIVHYFCDDFWLEMACRCCGGWSTFGLGWEPQLASISGGSGIPWILWAKMFGRKEMYQQNIPKMIQSFCSTVFFSNKNLECCGVFSLVNNEPNTRPMNSQYKNHFGEKNSFTFYLECCFTYFFPLTHVVLKLGWWRRRLFVCFL